MFSLFAILFQQFCSTSATTSQGRKHPNNDIGYVNETNSNYQNYKTEI